MEPTGSQLGLALLVLVLLPGCPGAEDSVCNRQNAPSLCYTFNVSASGPSWCVVRGKINGTPFLKYTSRSLKVKPIGPLGVMLSATEAWNQHGEHWKDLVEELRKALLDNQQKIFAAFHSLSLQGSMMCQQECNGRCSAFWEFGFNGQMCLRFDSKNRRWAELHPGCRLLKETLGSDRDVTNLLVGISRGDCVKLLHQSTVLDTKEDAAPKLLRVWSSSTRVPPHRLRFHHSRVLSRRPPGAAIFTGVRRS
ncbi:UL16-binding protein 6-like [Phyllostomus hastatus]|uniref:UL16-binding protein 6-like n=1 Tax=Phyllostomus hastatus TaxID=9423 RepID=UPI001E6853D3|nr:UL16-binding protein 6-like [Phyllostomus hastatus]XP_045698884.1 UL16-binding protein 6-like [Phyllostomus hastatus]XP_045698885.1 UL16-binding protein 6-like [Phyllostomus hastatus]